MALEAAQRLNSGLALGLLSGEELPGGWVHPPLGHRDAVKSAVELAIAAAIETVTDSLA